MGDDMWRHQPKNSSRDSQWRRGEIAALIARLLSHYWTADDDSALRKAQAEDWLNDLIEFDVDIVREACAEWRRTRRQRPTPSDIIALAAAADYKRLERTKLPAPSVALPRSKPKHKASWEEGYTGRYDEPWFRKLSASERRKYIDQDFARAEMHSRVINGQATAEDFVRLCLSQMRENLDGLVMQ